MLADCKRATAQRLQSVQDVVADVSELVDEELAERRDELSSLIVVSHDLLSAVQQPLCCSPGGTDITGCFVEDLGPPF